MSFRVLVISNSAKLDLKLSCLVVRTETITKIHLSEIAVLLIESTAVSLTSALLCELIKNKIKVVFCDEKRNPISELFPCHGTHDASLKIKMQIDWKKQIKESVWTEIVRQKIKNQRNILAKYGLMEFVQLDKYLEELEFYDKTNREGHAAKVYFNALFGKDFSRSADNHINSALNYGYSLLLSAFNREICNHGYLTNLGLFHDNMYNKFNLSCDLMEIFRTIVDDKVLQMNPQKFEKEEKLEIVNLLNKQVIIDDKTQYLLNAIKIYARSIFDVLNEVENSQIKVYKDEL